MYWLRTTTFLDPLIFTLLSIFWMAGGWLLVAHSRRFLRRERLLAGIAAGLLLYVLFANALAHWMAPYPAFVYAAVLVLAIGLWASRKSDVRRSDLFRPGITFQILPLIFIFGLFEAIMRGLGVGDDYAHFPLVSILAAGDIPPHYSLHPDIYLPYHYALDLFAAGLVRVGGFFPWSAWDISRSFVVALTLLCSWLWLRRIIRNRLGAFLGSLLIAFGMGTRWILMFLPSSWIDAITSNIHLIGSSQATGSTLAEALLRPWVIDGGPPQPIPYGFANGVFNPLTFDWSGAASLPFLALILILMLSGRGRQRWSGLVLLASAYLSLALSAEHVFILVEAGAGVAIGVMLLTRRFSIRHIRDSFLGQLALVVLVAGVLSLVQGGVITELARNYVMSARGVGATSSSSFSLRWPPAFFDSHMGSLYFWDWRQVVVILAECGPVLFLFPVILSRLRNDYRHKRLIEFGFAIASFFGILIPVFINYQVARDITRFTAIGLSLWLVLSIQPLWNFFRKHSPGFRLIIVPMYALTVFGGMALFLYQATAILAPQVSTFISSMDSRMSQTYWDRLEPRTMIFDSTGYRGQTLFGRLSIDTIDGFPKTEFLPYLNNPDPYLLRKLGFGYIYLDKRYWDHLSLTNQQSLSLSCLQVLNRMQKLNTATGTLSDFRILIDITKCQ